MDNKNDNNANNVGGMPCLNSTRCMEKLARQQRNIRQAKMKLGLLQIIYGSFFCRIRP